MTTQRCQRQFIVFSSRALVQQSMNTNKVEDQVTVQTPCQGHESSPFQLFPRRKLSNLMVPGEGSQIPMPAPTEMSLILLRPWTPCTVAGLICLEGTRRVSMVPAIAWVPGAHTLTSSSWLQVSLAHERLPVFLSCAPDSSRLSQDPCV